MVDTFASPQIDRCDLMCGEGYSEPAGSIEWTDRKPLATKGLWDFPQPAALHGAPLPAPPALYSITVAAAGLASFSIRTTRQADTGSENPCASCC
jgi:hypothetical protein